MHSIPKIRGLGLASIPKHFVNVPHMWALPIVKDEAIVIMILTYIDHKK